MIEWGGVVDAIGRKGASVEWSGLRPPSGRSAPPYIVMAGGGSLGCWEIGQKTV
ncbi:hypothetical protein PP187_gp224 [Klebsiella phage vB_KvM-Eowyn]|uniref:Uncharacterized protein n=1 Tax=Klebsiella phage vB_KvM-Eowyn TaxID=2762819 RepID=A0A7R8MKB2_9CAUD|nr:hypothetical protein PP187_gp224 [Klebsiella phage vB_KvM-Eowyn]CAD5236213.1 hypothetical protein LLCLJKAH_00224 [Klebsiella phage vB_KvM-Eowyn]